MATERSTCGLAQQCEKAVKRWPKLAVVPFRFRGFVDSAEFPDGSRRPRYVPAESLDFDVSGIATNATPQMLRHLGEIWNASCRYLGGPVNPASPDRGAIAWLAARNNLPEGRQPRINPFAELRVELLALESSPDKSIITDCGERVYEISGKRMQVTQCEDDVLQSFIGRESLSTRVLIELAKNDRAPRVLRELAKRYGGMFAPAITLPGKRGNGGFVVKVRTA